MRPIFFLLGWLRVKICRIFRTIGETWTQATYLIFPNLGPQIRKLLRLLMLGALPALIIVYLRPIARYIRGFDGSDLVAWAFHVELLQHLLFLLVRSFLLFLALGALLSVLRWLSGGGQGTVVLPFQNVTGDDRYNSPAISDALIAQLHRIRHIHHYLSEPQPGLTPVADNFPSILPRHENLEASLKDIGTIGINDSKLSVGHTLSALRRLWIFGRSGRVITGSIHHHDHYPDGASLEVVARVEDQQVRAWEANKAVKYADDLNNLIEELAFKLTIHLEPNLSAKNWQAFKYFTDAIASFTRYQQRQEPPQLRQAMNLCYKSLEYQHDYTTMINLLCRIGTAFYKETSFGASRYDDAERVFIRVLELDPQNTYANDGLGNIYTHKNQYEHANVHYKVAQKIDPNDPYAYNGQGNIHAFKYSWHLENIRKSEEEAKSKQVKENDKQTKEPHAQAQDSHKEAEKSYKRAKEFYKQAIRHNPKFVSPYYNLGLLYLNRYEYSQKQKSTIEENIERLKIGVWPFYPLRLRLRLRWVKRLGYRSLRCAEYNLKHAKALASMRSNNVPICYSLGWVYFRKKDFDAAIEEYEIATAIDPQAMFPYGNMGIAYLYKAANLQEEIPGHNPRRQAQVSFKYAIQNCRSTNKREKLSCCLYQITLNKLNSSSNQEQSTQEQAAILKTVENLLENDTTLTAEDLQHVIEDVDAIQESNIFPIGNHDDNDSEPLKVFKKKLAEHKDNCLPKSEEDM